ncbi:MAG: glycosyltransferase family 2 protein [Candidatus Daviesbacteria bacterium]|nr:glycosyltransferase family 2 protein [Candidatus Daviesbacteria bacterium]
MTKLAIITVNYNNKKDTLEFLDSLAELRTTNYQLLTIVVDNGSEDGLVEELVKNYPEVEVLQNGQNLGFAGGYNRGTEYAGIWGADYFLIINNDCLIKDASLLEELIKTAEKNKGIGLVSPKIYFAPGFEFHKERYKPSDLGKVIWYAGGHFDWDNIRSVHRGIDEVDSGQYDHIQEVYFASGACMLIKKEVLEKVGLFDKNYFLYFEDADFIKRVKDAGYKIFYNGKVSVFHKVSQSTGVGSLVTDYYHTRNRLIFGMKYGKWRTKLALFREAIKLFIFGRPAQRKGVLDYVLS